MVQNLGLTFLLSSDNATISRVKIRHFGYDAHFPREVREGDFFKSRPDAPGQRVARCVEFREFSSTGSYGPGTAKYSIPYDMFFGPVLQVRAVVVGNDNCLTVEIPSVGEAGTTSWVTVSRGTV